MKTIKLYQEDVYQRECVTGIAEVIVDPEALKSLGISAKRQTFAVIPQASVFFPTGGGQPCDTGTMIVDNSVDTPVEFSVVDVFERDDAVIHVVTPKKEMPAGFDPLSLRECPVSLSILWERRFVNMQRHCGEHILSGAFDRLFGGVNRGFHMGEDYMTVDISPEKNPAFDHITWEMAAQAERAANQVIWADAPITVRRFETGEEAAALPLRKPLAIDEDISIVTIGDPSHPSDCVACCGTHPSTAGQVGLIKIYKLENYKGMTRVYMEAGSRALEDYRLKHEVVMGLSSRYSAEADRLLDSVDKQNRRSEETRRELSELKRFLSEEALTEIMEFYDGGFSAAPSKPLSGEALHQLLSSGKIGRLNVENAPVPIACKSFPCFKADDVQTLGRKASDSIRGLLILISQKDHTAILFSGGKPDCGKLVRENVSICQGKGGGNATCARAIFSGAEAVENYVDLLEKHLR